VALWEHIRPGVFFFSFSLFFIESYYLHCFSSKLKEIPKNNNIWTTNCNPTNCCFAAVPVARHPDIVFFILHRVSSRLRIGPPPNARLAVRYCLCTCYSEIASCVYSYPTAQSTLLLIFLSSKSPCRACLPHFFSTTKIYSSSAISLSSLQPAHASHLSPIPLPTLPCSSVSIASPQSLCSDCRELYSGRTTRLMGGCLISGCPNSAAMRIPKSRLPY
jgi:hypothetical protein